MKDTMHPAASRVLAIPTLEKDAPATAGEAQLVRDYLENVRRLARAAGGWSRGPFFAPEELFPRELAPEHRRILADVHTWLVQPNPDVARICMDAVKWAGYADEGEALAVAHADLFEPLLRLFERGFGLHLRQGEAMLKGASVPLAGWPG